jgi:uncharacterized membrane protein YqjE
MATPQRSFPDLLQDIVANLEQIIRCEFRLAKTEIEENATKAARPAIAFGVGLVFAVYGLGFVLLACVYALSTVIAGWLAALLVGAGVSIVAVALMSSGAKKLKNMNFAPEKAIRSI